jgi:hypothetical protein
VVQYSFAGIVYRFTYIQNISISVTHTHTPHKCSTHSLSLSVQCVTYGIKALGPHSGPVLNVVSEAFLVLWQQCGEVGDMGGGVLLRNEILTCLAQVTRHLQTGEIRSVRECVCVCVYMP